MKQSIRHALPFLIILPGLAAAAAPGAAENPVANPGFESVAGGKPVGWQCPTGWAGEVRSVDGAGRTRAGLRALELRAMLKNGRHWARVMSGTLPVAMGLRHRFSIYARGNGDAKLGVIHYRDRNAQGKPHYVYTWQEHPVPLDDNWRQTAFEFDSPDDAVRMVPTIEIEGENRVALFDDAELETVRVEEGELTVAPYRMVPVGVPVDVTVTVRGRGGRPLAGAALAVVRRGAAAESAVVRERLTLDAHGRAVCRLDPARAPGLVRRAGGRGPGRRDARRRGRSRARRTVPAGGARGGEQARRRSLPPALPRGQPHRFSARAELRRPDRVLAE